MLREGFWSDDKKPTDFINTDYSSMEKGKRVIAQLQLIHEKIHSLSEIDWVNVGILYEGKIVADLQNTNYMGHHTCLICKEAAGCGEYTLKNKWVIPEGYKHYVEVHGVKPSEEFETFLLEQDVVSMELPTIEKTIVSSSSFSSSSSSSSCSSSSSSSTGDLTEEKIQSILQRGLGTVYFRIPKEVLEKNLQRVYAGRAHYCEGHLSSLCDVRKGKMSEEKKSTEVPLAEVKEKLVEVPSVEVKEKLGSEVPPPEHIAQKEKPPRSEIDQELDIAQKLKDDGNVAYKSGDYKKAIAKYTRMFLYTNAIHHGKLPLEGLSDLPSADGSKKQTTKEQVERAKKLRIDANYNCSLAYEKLSSLKKALEFAENILEFEENNSKAIYRRGHLYLRLGDIDAAEQDLNKAKELFPRDASVLTDCRLLQTKLKEQEAKRSAKERAMFGGIFNKSSK